MNRHLSIRDSSPTSLPSAGSYHFKNSVEILRDAPPPVRRTFEGSARDVTALASRLSALLEAGTKNGAPLSQIDACVKQMMRKCLEIERLTLQAMKDGVR